MAKPTAPTEVGGSKVMFGADSTATTSVAYAPTAIVPTTAGGDQTNYKMALLGMCSHGEGQSITAPGGFTTGSAPVMLIAGKTASAGNTAVPLVVTGTPATSDASMAVKLAGITPASTLPVSGTVTITPSGTQTVSGTVAATQSGTWNVGTVTTVTTVAAVTAISNALPTGTNTLGGILDTGWNFAAEAQQRGRTTLNSATETTLLNADASNLYNVTDIVVSTDGGAACTLTFRHGTAGTTFLVLRLPASVSTQAINLRMPDRGSTNQTVTVQSSSATPNIEITLHAYKTTS